MAKRRPRLTLAELPIVLAAAHNELAELTAQLHVSWNDGLPAQAHEELTQKYRKASRRVLKLESVRRSDPAAVALAQLKGWE